MSNFNKTLLLLLLLSSFLQLPAAEKDRITVAVFSINDFHGGFVRNDYKDMPGAAAIWQTLDSLKQAYPYHVTVAAGDNFGGSYFYNATKGTLLPVFFNGIGIRLSAVGNHEFDDGQASLAAKWKDDELHPEGWDITYVCANVRNDKGEIPAFAQPFATEKISLPDGREITVGFVGLLTSSTPQQASASKLKGLSFDGNYPAVVDSVKRLPGYDAIRNADIRLLLTHIGTTEDTEGTPRWNDKEAGLLQTFSDRDFHAILTAHTHEKVCGEINAPRYPVTQGKWHGEYISVVTFRLDTLTKEVTEAKAQLCKVRPDIALGAAPKRLQAQIDSLLQATKTQGGTPIGLELTTARRTLVHERAQKYQQTEMGRLVCTSYAEAFRKAARLGDKVPIVGVSHFGSIRGGFTAGPVSVLDVGEALPFSNALRIYRISGRQLHDLLNFGYRNKTYGWIQTSGLNVTLDGKGNIGQVEYISPQGHRSTIKEDDTCYLVADEYMTTGGDGYSPSFFPASQEVKVEGMPATTDAFISYLKGLEEIM